MRCRQIPPPDAQFCSTARFSGQAVVDIVIGSEHRGDLPKIFASCFSSQRSLQPTSCWLMPFAATRMNSRSSISRRKIRHFGGATSVALLYRGSQQLSGLIEKDDRRKHAGHADARDIPCRHAGLGQELRHEGANIRPPLLWILFRPSRMAGGQGHRPGSDRQNPVGQTDQDSDRGRRADVQPRK